MVQATDDIDAMEENLPQTLKILSEMSKNAHDVSQSVDGMLEQVRSGDLSTEHGLSFLEIKYHSLLDYLINLTFVVLRKCSGETIEKDPSIERLLELRTILDKIRPIDFKLRYQIDKLVKTATTGRQDPNDPTNFKPRPDLLLSQLGKAESENDDEDDDADNDDDDDDDNDGRSKVATASGVYRPPKLTAMPYDDGGVAEKRRKQEERARKRKINSAITQEMREEFDDAPVEVAEGSRMQQKYMRAQKERERYEEDNFVRLPVTKADKHRQRQLTTTGTLGDDITWDIGSGDKKGKKRKIQRKGGKKGGKKRKFH